MQDEGTTIDACSEADATFLDTTTCVSSAAHLEGTGCGLLQHYIADCTTCERTSCISIQAGAVSHAMSLAILRQLQAVRAISVLDVSFSPRLWSHRGSRFRQHDFIWVECNIGGPCLSAHHSERRKLIGRCDAVIY